MNHRVPSFDFVTNLIQILRFQGFDEMSGFPETGFGSNDLGKSCIHVQLFVFQRQTSWWKIQVRFVRHGICVSYENMFGTHSQMIRTACS